MIEAQDIIAKLGLEPLPEEGGFFRQTYKDPEIIADKDRSYSTCIYYLITPDEFSGLHAVKSTEVFHFYAGDPVEMVQITPSGELSKVVIGSDIFAGQLPQVVVSPLVWQGTKLVGKGRWALLGCTVAPGFEYKDFIAGTFEGLSKEFPRHRDVIRVYTHE